MKENKPPFYSKILNHSKREVRQLPWNYIPVPFTSLLNVQVDLPNAEKLKIRLLNPDGKLLKLLSVEWKQGHKYNNIK